MYYYQFVHERRIDFNMATTYTIFLMSSGKYSMDFQGEKKISNTIKLYRNIRPLATIPPTPWSPKI